MSNKQQIYVCVTKSNSKSKNGKLSCVPISNINNTDFVNDEKIQESKISTKDNRSKNCSKCHSKGKISNISNNEQESNKRILPSKNAIMDKVLIKNVIDVPCPIDGSSGNGIVPIPQMFPGGEPVCLDGSLGYGIL